ncbi:MAG: TetR/AcrR family transcriptional regulator [Planctomycetota bacterium]
MRVATGLFCREGFHATGIDRVLGEAGVAKMTLYKHFASKDDLIAACLADVHAGVEAAIEALLADAGPDPAGRALAIVAWHAEQAASRGFDGCPFHHARAEYADPDHPAHRAACEHKDWVRGHLLRLLVEAGHPDAENGAFELELVVEGALAAGALRASPDITSTALRLARRVLGSAG